MKAPILKMSLLAFVASLGLSVSAGAQSHSPSNSDEFEHVDPRGIVPRRALSQALAYFKKYRNYFENQNVLTVIDYTAHSNRKRMYLIDLKTGAVEAHQTAHGKNSDLEGYARSFSNHWKSKKSSVGFFRTGETYQSKKVGYALRLDGLSRTNSNARYRGLVLHGAWYVDERTGSTGRSHGCPAMDPKVFRNVIEKIRGGSLLYAWSGQ